MAFGCSGPADEAPGTGGSPGVIDPIEPTEPVELGDCCLGEDGEGGPCCDDPGPDVVLNEGALVIDGKVNHVSVNHGVVLFQEGACVCGYLNINSKDARVYVDEWSEGPPLHVENDANVNTNAYLYVQSGGVQVRNNFANNSRGATLVEGDLEAGRNLYLNSPSLMCKMEGRLDADRIFENGGVTWELGEPDIEFEVEGGPYSGDLDQVADEIAELLDQAFPSPAEGATCRAHFMYGHDSLAAPIRLPMLFDADDGEWREVGRF